MASAKNIETRLLSYLSYLSERNKMVVLNVAKTLVKEAEKEEETYTGLSPAQLEELDRRWENYKNGTSRSYTLEEVKERAYKNLKNIKRK